MFPVNMEQLHYLFTYFVNLIHQKAFENSEHTDKSSQQKFSKGNLFLRSLKSVSASICLYSKEVYFKAEILHYYSYVDLASVFFLSKTCANPSPSTRTTFDQLHKSMPRYFSCMSQTTQAPQFIITRKLLKLLSYPIL